MRAVPFVFGGRGSEHPEEGGVVKKCAGGGGRVAFALASPGVLERGRAGTSLVTWAQTGELERAKP